MANCVVCSAEIRDDARFCPSCGAEQPTVTQAEGDDPFLGRTISRNFKIEKLLGVGGMGKVYKARQLSLDKDVVIKVLHDHFRDDPQLVQRFQREARAASRLNHPNSIQVIDFGQDESGVLFMAIEFLNGTDLFTVLQKEGPFPCDRVSRIMIQVCSALAEAHEMNVIHRDLKPENIMVEDRRGRKDMVKVLDFGIAKIQDPDETPGQALTQAGMVCGTPEYMSPEQARGQQLDPRADLYSLGVLVYQLVTGELPFLADSPIGIVTKHILEEPVPPSQKRPDLMIPAALEHIILRAMAKEADQRFQSAHEMMEAFEDVIRTATGSVNLGFDETSGSLAPRGTDLSTPVLSSGSGPQIPTETDTPAAQVVPQGTPTSGGQPGAPTGTQVQMSQTGAQAAHGGPRPTSPTPTGLMADASTLDDIDSLRPGGSGGMKWAAVALIGVLVAAGGAFVVLSDDEVAPANPGTDGEGTGGTKVAGSDAKDPDADPAPAGDPSGAATGNGKVDDGKATNDTGKPPVATKADDTGKDDGKAPTAVAKKDDDDDDRSGRRRRSSRTSKRDDGKRGGSEADDRGTRVAKADDDDDKKDDRAGRGRSRGGDRATDTNDEARDKPAARGRGSSKSSGDRDAAKSLLGDANTALANGNPNEAYRLAKAAISADANYPEPRTIIAQYWYMKGDTEKSCRAANDYVKLKGRSLSRKQAEGFLQRLRCTN